MYLRVYQPSPDLFFKWLFEPQLNAEPCAGCWGHRDKLDTGFALWELSNLCVCWVWADTFALWNHTAWEAKSQSGSSSLRVKEEQGRLVGGLDCSVSGVFGSLGPALLGGENWVLELTRHSHCPCAVLRPSTATVGLRCSLHFYGCPRSFRAGPSFCRQFPSYGKTPSSPGSLWCWWHSPWVSSISQWS